MKKYSHLYLTLLTCCFLLLVHCIPLQANQLEHTSKTDEKNQTSLFDDRDQKNYFALIIGNETKGNTNHDARSDISAQHFYDAFRKGLNYHTDNMRLLLNQNASNEKIKSAIIDWLDPLESSDDVIIVYFNGNLSPPAFSTSLNGEDNQTVEPDIESLSDDLLDSWLDHLESEQIYIFLDTDYASYQPALSQWGRDILASTGYFYPKKESILHKNQMSIFTYFIEKGLEGYADYDYNGIIDASEFFDYVEKNTHQYQIDLSKLSFFNPKFYFQSPKSIKRIWKDTSLLELPFGWKQLTDDGFGQDTNYATRGMEVFNGDLYIGTQNSMMLNTLNLEKQPHGMAAASVVPDLYSILGPLSRYPARMVIHLMTVFSQGCEVWKYNHSTDDLAKMVGKDSITGIGPGFGTHLNAAAAVMKVFNNHLYVGTWNSPIGTVRNQFERSGCEIWRTADGINWEQVVGHIAPFTEGGFGNPDNSGAWSIYVFNGTLYVGTMNWDFSDTGGCEVWRSTDGLHWEQVVDHGFRPFMDEEDKAREAINTYAWTMQEYHDELYLGTFNARLWLWNERGTGCQLWKTGDGSIWEKVALPDGFKGAHDGFGEGENYGIRRMTIYNDELYVGVASSFFHDHGCEIWRYDGTRWEPVISDEIPGVNPTDTLYDGFGNTMNKYIWSMTVTDDNKLWVGTGNGQVYLPIIYKGEREKRGIRTETQGCEIWCYDGMEWNPVIRNDIGLQPNGMGDSTNLGARSMIEYPKDSGNIVVGTFKLFDTLEDIPRNGCELWLRYVVKG